MYVCVYIYIYMNLRSAGMYKGTLDAQGQAAGLLQPKSPLRSPTVGLFGLSLARGAKSISKVNASRVNLICPSMLCMISITLHCG